MTTCGISLGSTLFGELKTINNIQGQNKHDTLQNLEILVCVCFSLKSVLDDVSIVFICTADFISMKKS